MTQQYKLPPLPFPVRASHAEYSSGDMEAYATAAIALDRQGRGEPVGEVAEIRGERVADISTWELECLPLGTKLYAAPQPSEPVKDETIWCLHILGPDDVHAAPSKAYAEVAADLHNARFSKATKESGVMCKAVVAPWPHDSASHARGLANFVSNWIAPQPAAPVVKESLTVADPVKVPSDLDVSRLADQWGISSDGRGIKAHTNIMGFVRDVLARYANQESQNG